MINSIQIKNFKSVVDLKLDLGSFNVLIGENGCGKSNILEAIAFGAAASADKLDFEFLGSRGIRLTNPEFMFSAFTNGRKKKKIVVNFSTYEKIYAFILENKKNSPSQWSNNSKEYLHKIFKKIVRASELLSALSHEKRIEILSDKGKMGDIINELANASDKVKDKNKRKEIFTSALAEAERDIFTNNEISNFIVYSPEQSKLRQVEETIQIYPIGIKGEGLFQYLKELSSNKKHHSILSSIKNNLTLLDWFEDFGLPDNLLRNEFTLKIKDKYLAQKLQYFDQRSTNEGFLYLLFYSTLFISKITPTFFAIDNIDTSLNPKLCSRLTKNLAALAKKHKKQAIVTTQNPAVLDGLDLKDDEQRLFVIRRNDQGYTVAKRIEYKSESKMKLSEVWTNGFIGGLPDNF